MTTGVTQGLNEEKLVKGVVIHVQLKALHVHKIKEWFQVVLKTWDTLQAETNSSYQKRMNQITLKDIWPSYKASSVFEGSFLVCPRAHIKESWNR